MNLGLNAVRLALLTLTFVALPAARFAQSGAGGTGSGGEGGMGWVVFWVFVLVAFVGSALYLLSRRAVRNRPDPDADLRKNSEPEAPGHRR